MFVPFLQETFQIFNDSESQDKFLMRIDHSVRCCPNLRSQEYTVIMQSLFLERLY